MTERTFSIIKPDATRRNLTGKVNAVIEDAGLRIVAQRRIQMSKAQAEKFYEVHKERPFYGELVEDQLEQRGLAHAVAPDEAHLGVLRERDRGAVEESASPGVEDKVIDLKHGKSVGGAL